MIDIHLKLLNKRINPIETPIQIKSRADFNQLPFIN